MTEDYRDYWIVRLGELYFSGLGESFFKPGYTGWVMTKVREHAQQFTSLDAARSAAHALGGAVIKVAPAIKVGPPCCNRNGPGPNEP